MPAPIAPEFVVNSLTDRWQQHPNVAVLENGDVVVV